MQNEPNSARPPRFLKLLATDQIDVLMAVINQADRSIYDFESKVLPQCRKRNVGVVAMKVYAGIKGGFPHHSKGWVGCNTPGELLPKALAYALDLEGVSVANVRPFTVEPALQNVERARQTIVPGALSICGSGACSINSMRKNGR